jgi:glucose/arabinose dehydrogenase
MRRIRLWCAALVAATLGVPAAARATLDTAGFRAVAVAHATHPVSAIGVAPDGRLFVAVQALAPTAGSTPGSAEIRVYGAYAKSDGSTLDEGAHWATVDGVRATGSEEGLVGLALAPDFAASKLVYVYVTTTDEGVNQHVRVYRENAGGTGDLVGTVATSLEPPVETNTRNGGALAFGVDGCLYVGVGDNGSTDRWNAQVLLGTTGISGSETSSFCTNVCLGSATNPSRASSNGAVNSAGKILRFAVSGGPAAPAADPPFAASPLVFATGFRNPTGLGVHPLTGQLFAVERGDGLQTELDVMDRGSDAGWPCIEGGTVPANASCLVGHTPADVYQYHPDWRRPLATHAGNPAITAVAAYTGLAYPDAYYGDVFYLLRDSDRIYRVDLDPPCFLPHPGGVAASVFHDSTNDDDFAAVYDINGDNNPDFVTMSVLTAIAQGPDPLGRQVLYVAGKQGNSGAFTEHSAVFRIEYATAFTPYAGPPGRVADACFTGGVYSGGGSGPAPYAWENPFLRPACMALGGVCAGKPDGTACDAGDRCHAGDTCQAGVCAPGAALPDGTLCVDADPCNGDETCHAGVCKPGTGPRPLGVGTLGVKRDASGGTGALTLVASFQPTRAIAPTARDAVTLELTDGDGTIFSGVLAHPASDPLWHRRGSVFQYRDRRGTNAGLTTLMLKTRKGGTVQLEVAGKRVHFERLGDGIAPRLVIGDQCFSAPATHCAGKGRRLRCRR